VSTVYFRLRQVCSRYDRLDHVSSGYYILGQVSLVRVISG
jgi:hypothetical protein